MVPKELEKAFWVFVLVWVFLAIGFMSIYVFRLGNNNWLEELSEDVIEYASGIEINISGEEEK